MDLGLSTRVSYLRRPPPVLPEAVAMWRADRYSGSGPLLDLSGNGHDAQLGSVSGADTNDPLFLLYSGEKYLYLPGTSGNRTQSNNGAVVTGDLDLRVSLEDQGSGANRALLANSLANSTAGDEGYFWRINSADTLTLFWNPAASTAPLSATTTATVPADATALRVTLDVDDGSSQRVIHFQYKTDDPSDTLLSASGWTTLETVTQAGTTQIHAGNRDLAVGAPPDSSTNLFTGRIYRAQAYDGIDGTLVADFNAEDFSEPHTTAVSSATGETWTINRSSSGRKSALVDRPLFLLGTDDYLEIADHADLDFALADDFTVVVALRSYDWGVTSPIIGKSPLFTSASAGYLLFHTNLGNHPRGSVGDGTNATLANGPVVIDGEAVTAAIRRNTSTDKFAILSDGVSGTAVTDASTASSENATPLRIGRIDTSFGNFELIGAAIFREALTDAQIARLNAEFGV